MYALSENNSEIKAMLTDRLASALSDPTQAQHFLNKIDPIGPQHTIVDKYIPVLAQSQPGMPSRSSGEGNATYQPYDLATRVLEDVLVLAERGKPFPLALMWAELATKYPEDVDLRNLSSDSLASIRSQGSVTEAPLHSRLRVADVTRKYEKLITHAVGEGAATPSESIESLLKTMLEEAMNRGQHLPADFDLSSLPPACGAWVTRNNPILKKESNPDARKRLAGPGA